MKSNIFPIAIITLAFVATVIAVIGGAFFRSGLDLTVGMYSTERIRAPFALINEQATERNRIAALEIAENLEQRYTIDSGEWQFVENNLLILRTDIVNIRAAFNQELAEHTQAVEAWETKIAEINLQALVELAEWEAMEADIITTGGDLSALPPRPEAPESPAVPIWQGRTFYMFAPLQMSFSDAEQELLVMLADESFEIVWDAIGAVAYRVQTSHEISEIDFMTERAVQRAIDTLAGLDRLMEQMVENIVLNHLRKNVIPDDALNEQLFQQHRLDYEQVLIQYNQILLDEGDMITEDIYYLLNQLGILRSETIDGDLAPMLGAVAFAAFLFLFSIMYLYFYRPKMAKNKKEMMLLFTIYILCLALVWALRGIDFPFLPQLPLLMFPMLVSLLIDRRSAIILSVSMVFICFFVATGSLHFIVFYIPTSILICLFSRFTTERNKVYLVGVLVSLIMFVLAMSASLIIERSHALSDLQSWLTAAGFAAACGMLTVIICTGSLPFWETLFGVVTPLKLLDLTNPTNPLLRRLTIEAPGTYHHSLIVANLAEKAAMDIGANPGAARVGGYYHDIGKLLKPHYFAENLDGSNPHDHLTPQESAAILTEHVTYGLQLAEEHRMPPIVRDIIKEHHGNTLQQYFYAKAQETDPQVNPKNFRYPYQIPQSKEAACVMLADSVEAAVRATAPRSGTVDDIEKTIRKIVRGKLSDNQLDDSQLSIKDILVIEQSFLRVLKGMYHERIVYPKATS